MSEKCHSAVAKCRLFARNSEKHDNTFAHQSSENSASYPQNHGEKRQKSSDSKHGEYHISGISCIADWRFPYLRRHNIVKYLSPSAECNGSGESERNLLALFLFSGNRKARSQVSSIKGKPLGNVFKHHEYLPAISKHFGDIMLSVSEYG